MEEATAGLESNYIRARRLLQYARERLAAATREAWEVRTGVAWTDSCGEQLLRLLQGKKVLQFKEQSETVRRGDVEHFDVTLLCRVLPAIRPMTTAAKEALEKVREARNAISHVSKDELPDNDFVQLFSSLGDALADCFGGDRAAIERVRALPIDVDTAELLKSSESALRAAKEYKEEGNRCYRCGNFDGAVDYYTQGVQLGTALDKSLLAQLVGNRSEAWHKLNDFGRCRADAEYAVQLDPLSWRSHQRLAKAHMALEEYAQAAPAYERAVTLLPSQTSPNSSDAVRELKLALDEAKVKGSARARHEELNATYAPSGRSTGRYEQTNNARSGLLPGVSSHDAMLRLIEMKEELGDLTDWWKGYRHVLLGHQHASKGDYAHAIQQHTVAATSYNHAEAMYNLAAMTMNGRGTPINVRLAEYWLRKALAQPETPPKDDVPREMATLGHAAAWNMMGTMFANGHGSFPKASEEAARCYQRSADLSWPSGLNNLGHFYRYGYGGLPVDLERASDLFRRAAELGENEAMFNFGGLCNERGDLVGARTWFQAALDHGLAAAADPLALVEDALARATAANAHSPQMAMKGGAASSLAEHVTSALKTIAARSDEAASPFVVSNERKPTLAELQAIVPRTPYLERLVTAKAGLVSAAVTLTTGAAEKDMTVIAKALAGAARALRTPDVDMVFDVIDIAPLLNVAYALWELAPSPDVAAILSTVPPMPTVASAVAWLRKIRERFPDDSLLRSRLATALLYPGPDFNLDEAVMLLSTALSKASTDAHDPHTSDLRFLLGSALVKSDRAHHILQAQHIFTEFVKVAALDSHRKLGAAHIHLGLLEIRLLASKRDNPALSLARVRKRYDDAMAAKNALPPFLRSRELGTATELELRLAAYPMGHPVESVLASPSLLGSSLAADGKRYGGEGLASSARPLAKPPAGVTVQLRRYRADHVDTIKGRAAALQLHGTPQSLLLKRTWAAPLRSTWSGTPADDAALQPIQLAELLAPRRDHVYEGRALTLLLVTVAVRYTSLFAIAEDAARDCVLLAVYNTPQSADRRWVPGRVLRVRNPYARAATHGDAFIVRVDEPDAALVTERQPLLLCWHCLVLVAAPLDLKRCGRCNIATYCSPQCQREDWTENAHSLTCSWLRYEQST